MRRLNRTILWILLLGVLGVILVDFPLLSTLVTEASSDCISSSPLPTVRDSTCRLSTVHAQWMSLLTAHDDNDNNNINDRMVGNNRRFPLAPPTTTRPLVFFHVRKASGTSIRKYLYLVATRTLQVPNWVVCYSTSCENQEVPTKERYAVYGGHFSYAAMLNVLGFQGTEPQSQGGIQIVTQPHQTAIVTPPFDCLVNLRPTVSRVVSCWNYRFGGQDGPLMDGFVPADQVSPEQWERDLPVTFSRHREGCNNELVRIFGDISNEARVNSWRMIEDGALATMSSTASRNNNKNSNKNNSKNNRGDNYFLATTNQCSAARELDQILARLSECTILIHSHCQDNMIILQHYMPWLKQWFNEEFCNDYSQQGVIQSKSLQPGAEEAILSQNRLDEYIYQFGLALHKKQLLATEAGTG